MNRRLHSPLDQGCIISALSCRWSKGLHGPLEVASELWTSRGPRSYGTRTDRLPQPSAAAL